MTIIDFCGDTEFSVIEYVFVLTKKIERKIKNGKFFYDGQIKRYIKKQVNQFFFGSTLDGGLIALYKHRIYNSVLFRLRPLLQEENILKVV